MRTLMRLLLCVSSLCVTLQMTSCEDSCIGDIEINHCVIINATENGIRFFSNNPQCAIEICSGDTISYETSEEDEFLNFTYALDPKIIVGKDSTIALPQSYYSCWMSNCHNTKIGPYEWVHTYVIDDQWLIDAWTESKTGECPPGAKHNWYD